MANERAIWMPKDQLYHDYQHHPSFINELDNFIRSHCDSTSSTDETMQNIERLLNTHFFSPSKQFTPKHFGKAQGFGAYEMYWMHLIIPHARLKRTQLPKVYVYRGKVMSFLCLDTHLTNYSDSKLRKLAMLRLSEVLETLN